MPIPFAEVERLLAATDHDAMKTLQLVTAEWIGGQHYPQVDPGQPMLVVQVADQKQAQDIARTLLAAYPQQHPVTVISADAVQTMSLAELAETNRIAGESHLFVPPLSRPASYTALQQVTARLRAPDGCPWDRELTWAALRSSLLEESYELLSALDAEDPAKVSEELGDLLLQIALQTQIAIEEGLFQASDVISGIVNKLIRRHPHVFGDTRVNGTAEVLANWEAIKAAERARSGEKRSPLAGVPASLPALAQAQAYLDRMSRLRDQEAPAAPWQRLAELKPEEPVTEEAVGDALFGLVAWAQARGIEAESALRATNARFASEVARVAEGQEQDQPAAPSGGRSSCSAAGG